MEHKVRQRSCNRGCAFNLNDYIFFSLLQTNRFSNKEENFKFRERKWYLNNTMVFVVLDIDSAESTVHAIQAVHIASMLGATTMQLACFKEALSK